MTQKRRLFDIQLELLKNELESIDGAIRQYDEISKSIKNWAVVTWSASVGLSLKEYELHAYIWATAVIPLVFWVVDGTFRNIQRSFIRRVEKIAKFYNSDAFKIAAESGSSIDFPLYEVRIKTGCFKDTVWGAMLFKSVAFLYIGLAICSIMIWFQAWASGRC